ncbi:MAG TPA: hypothetical protein VF600_08420 [Abditibacteriaceae bacterium]|jgi:hypothetical protein
MANSKPLLLLIACGGLFFGALFLYIGWRLWSNGRELRSTGISTHATVQKKFRKAADRSWGGLENYYVRCAFQDANGQAHETEIKVPSKLWRQLREGGTLAITYLPGHVEMAQAGPRWGWQVRGVLGIGLMLLGLAALVVFPLGILREMLQSVR